MISPVIALAAAVAGEARYTNDFGFPILPRKFLLEVDRQTSSSARIPSCIPQQTAHPGELMAAPAFTNISSSPSLLA